MKRLPMKDILRELLREIAAVARLSDEAFANKDFEDFLRLKERIDGLHLCLHLLEGNHVVVGCYQTGMNPNSGGATYKPRKVIE